MVQGVYFVEWVKKFKEGGFRKELVEFEALITDPPEHFKYMFGDLYTSCISKGGSYFPLEEDIKLYVWEMDTSFTDGRHIWCKFGITQEEIIALNLGPFIRDALRGENVLCAISESGAPKRENWELARFMCLISIAMFYERLCAKMGIHSNMLYVPSPFDSITFYN